MRKILRIVVSLSLVLAGTSPIGCRHRNSANDVSFTREVVQAEFNQKREIVDNFKLAQVDKLNTELLRNGSKPIPYKAEKAFVQERTEDATLLARFSDSAQGKSADPKKKTREPVDTTVLDSLSNYHLVVSIGPIETIAQFNTLLKIYGGEGNVPFEAGKTYQLTDFLNPKMQAMIGRQFANQRETFAKETLPDINGRAEGDGREVGLVTNCYQAAYEATRGGSDPIAYFFADINDYDKHMRDTKFSSEVKVLTLEERRPAGFAKRNKGLERGDVLMLYHPYFDQRIGKVSLGKELGHIAVFLDDDLYFEKTGPFSSSLYRLVTYADMVAPDSYTDSGDYQFTDIRLRRFRGERLPSASDAFSVAAEKASLIKEAKSIVNSDGAPWSAITRELGKQLMVVNQPGMGGNQVLFFYSIKEKPLVQDSKSKRFKPADEAFDPNSFWF